MTESGNDASGDALFTRIRQMVEARGVDIRLQQDDCTLKLLFADGQRVLVNLDRQSSHVWLAAAGGGSEFLPHGEGWRSPQHGELLARLQELIEQAIAADPRNARAPTAPTVAAAPTIVRQETERGHPLRNIIIVVLLAAAAYGLLQEPAQQQRNAPDGADAPAQIPMLAGGTQQPCESVFPANGSTTQFAESALHLDRPDAQMVSVSNDHAHPLLLLLTEPRTVIPALSVLIHARQHTTLKLPPGEYDMMFAAGSQWCNARSGFSDGRMLKFGNSLAVQSDKPVRIAMQSSGAGPEDFQVFVSTAVASAPPPPPSFSGDGSIAVQRHDNGHFYLPGSIEGVPVTFLVDTGASVTSVSADIARQAGLRNCKEVQFQTANGAATGCIALVPQMTLGNFTLKNITVAVMPNMETNLLGANVLRNFRVGQDGNTLLIGRN